VSKGIFPQYEEVDFEVEKEVWNIYELEDGRHRVTLKMRTILTKLLKPRIIKPETPPPGVPPGARKEEFQMSFQNIVIVSSCPPELMGDPSPPIHPSEFQKLPQEEIKFIPFSEDWNVYRIPDSGLKLRVKLVVSSINKIKERYDQFGYPIYQVQSTNAIVPVPPPSKKK